MLAPLCLGMKPVSPHGESAPTDFRGVVALHEPTTSPSQPRVTSQPDRMSDMNLVDYLLTQKS